MPDVQEVFRMATQKVRPDPGAMERQHREQRRHVAKRKAGVYALVAGIIVAGLVIGISVLRETDEPEGRPGGAVEDDAPTAAVEGAPPTAEELDGIWYEDPGTGTDSAPNMFWFDGDGTFTWGGVLEHDSWIVGTYEIDGHRITVTATGGFCGGGYVFTWDAGIVDDGRLEAVHRGAVTDTPGFLGECDLPVGERFGMTKVSPASSAPPADIAPGFYVGDLTNDTTPLDLQGFWLVEGTSRLFPSYLLRLDFSGAYILDDGGELATNPDDVGIVEIGRRSLTFVSGARSALCSEGDALVLTNVRVEDGALRGVEAEDSCGRGFAEIGDEVTLRYLDIQTP